MLYLRTQPWKACVPWKRLLFQKSTLLWLPMRTVDWPELSIHLNDICNTMTCSIRGPRPFYTTYNPATFPASILPMRTPPTSKIFCTYFTKPDDTSWNQLVSTKVKERMTARLRIPPTAAGKKNWANCLSELVPVALSRLHTERYDEWKSCPFSFASRIQHPWLIKIGFG